MQIVSSDTLRRSWFVELIRRAARDERVAEHVRKMKNWKGGGGAQECARRLRQRAEIEARRREEIGS